MPRKPPQIIDGKKACSKCGELQPLSEFYKHCRKSSGMHSRCKKCCAVYEFARYHSETPEVRKVRVARLREYVRNNPAARLWSQAKQRAKADGVAFSIGQSDVVIPERCPVFGVPLVAADRNSAWGEFSPTLDRIIPSRGYVPGNVQVISKLANVMKSSATPDQLIQFAEWALKNFSLDRAA